MDEIASCITKKDNTPDNAATAFSAFAIPIETPIANISARLSKMILPQSPPTLKIPYKTVQILGITSLQLGVFGGIIVGLGVGYLHNRLYKIKLPEVLSFFGGTRAVPIICTIVYVGVGILMFFIWPPIQGLMYSLGGIVKASGYFGTFI